MRNEGLRPGRRRISAAGAPALAGVLAGLLAGCAERDRFLLPDLEGPGPVTTIDRPGAVDTTVSAGPDFFVTGRTVDPDGLDTVYFTIQGGLSHFPPYVGEPGEDTVRFGLPLTTNGLGGELITITIHGVDALGNQGERETRQIRIAQP